MSTLCIMIIILGLLLAIESQVRLTTLLSAKAAISSTNAMEQRCDHGPVQQEITSYALLSAPHILYAVFLYLPQQDLLLIQRVCRVCRQMVTSSRVLQAALCFQPLVNATTGDTLNASVRMNTLLLSRLRHFG